MPLKTKTFPYGTTRSGTVVFAESAPFNGANVTILSVVDDQREGHLLLGTDSENTIKEGDQGHLVFTKGGPTGGYWRFEKTV